jgi:hypothetical protein
MSSGEGTRCLHLRALTLGIFSLLQEELIKKSFERERIFNETQLSVSEYDKSLTFSVAASH